MQTISCPQCGHSIAEDDFITQQCPVCDSYMRLSRLDTKAHPDLGKIIRINPVQPSALVERE